MNKCLTEKQRIASALIGNGMYRNEVARKVGVDESTVRRWLKLTAFRDAVSDALNDAMLEAGSLALAELIAELKDDNVYVRQNAARDLLTRYSAALESGSKTITVHLEGAPELGMPDADE